MIKGIDAKRVMNGTFGEVWIDSDKVGECYGSQAKIDFKKEPVPQCGNMGEDSKVVGFTGKGSVRINKVFSRMAIKLAPLVKEGKDIRFTIISKLADPDAFGAERVAYKNVSFDDLTLADWESGKISQVECPFTFTDYEFLDMVEPQ